MGQTVTGGTTEHVQTESRWIKSLPNAEWDRSSSDYCRVVICPHCFAAIFKVEHDGRLEWLDRIQSRWIKHDCLYPDLSITETDELSDNIADKADERKIQREKRKRLRTFFRALPCLLEKVAETVQRPGKFIIAVRQTGRIHVAVETIYSKSFREEWFYEQIASDLWEYGLWDYKEHDVHELRHKDISRADFIDYLANGIEYSEFLLVLEILNGRVVRFDGFSSDIQEIWSTVWAVKSPTQ